MVMVNSSRLLCWRRSSC